MHTHRCLASIAELEFNALVQDTKSALDGLQRQRESAAKALEMAQHANERSGQQCGETDAPVASLLDRLHRLNAALDQLKREIEQLEATSILLGETHTHRRRASRPTKANPNTIQRNRPLILRLETRNSVYHYFTFAYPAGTTHPIHLAILQQKNGPCTRSPACSNRISNAADSLPKHQRPSKGLATAGDSGQCVASGSFVWVAVEEVVERSEVRQ